MKSTVKYSKIKKGQYTVRLNMNTLMKGGNLNGFEEQLAILCQRDQNFANICTFKKGILKYKSETLFPDSKNKVKQKILFVFGNPASHSVVNGMFFFSRKDGRRHSMWGKLAKADVIKEVINNSPILTTARKKEAKKRRKMISAGGSADNYLVGMTTFYSFPSSVNEGVKEVTQLFKPVLEEINAMEIKRILSYSFTSEAKLVFVQKSTHDAFCNSSEQANTNTIYWPIRGKNSAGEYLKKMLVDE